jgi:hypothetical protein
MLGTGNHCSDLLELSHLQSLQEIATQHWPEAMINTARRESSQAPQLQTIYDAL